MRHVPLGPPFEASGANGERLKQVCFASDFMETRTVEVARRLSIQRGFCQ